MCEEDDDDQAALKRGAAKRKSLTGRDRAGSRRGPSVATSEAKPCRRHRPIRLARRACAAPLRSANSALVCEGAATPMSPRRTADIARPLAAGGDAQSRSSLATETLGATVYSTRCRRRHLGDMLFSKRHLMMRTYM